MVTTNMGNGTKFKLSNVLPNVFSNLIKGIGPRKNNYSKKKGSSSSPAPSECAIIDQTDIPDFSVVSRRSHLGELSPSPVRVFPQNADIRDIRHSSSPVPSSQKTYDICFPAESPVRSGGNKSRPHSPAPLRARNSTYLDPGCSSYEESRTSLVPHVDGRVRRANPTQSFGRCSLMSKCSTFEGSTHSDSDVSDVDTSRVHSRMRHARANSVQLDRSSWPEGYGKLTAAVESARRRSDNASAPQRSSFRERREQNMQIMEHGRQLYGGSSPINHAAMYDNSTLPAADYTRAEHTGDSSESHHGSACPNSSRDGTDLDHDQTTTAGGRRQGRFSRKLSFTTDDNVARPFDETSFSSDDEFFNLRRSVDSKVPMGKYQLRSLLAKKKAPPEQQQQLSTQARSEDKVEAGSTSSTEVAELTEDEKSHAAMLRREAVLAKTVLDASDGWARVQLSRFSHDEKPTRRRVSYDDHDGKRDSEAAYMREATLVNTSAVLGSKDWTRENLRALAKANEVDRETLARLRASQQEHLPVKREADPEEENMVEHQTFGLPPNSVEVFSRRISRHASPIGEVEKHTEGKIDYRNSSPGTNRAIKPKETGRNFGSENFARTVPDSAGNFYKSPRTETVKSEKDFESSRWDTEFPSFRSDSMLLGGPGAGGRGGLGRVGSLGSGRIVPEERTSLIEFCEPEVAAPRTPKYMERQRQNKLRLGQHQDFRSGNRSPSPRREMTSATGMKNVRASNQSPSPRRSHVQSELSTRPKPSASPTSIQEFISRKKLSNRSPSPIQDNTGKKISSRSPSPMPDKFQQVKKPGSTKPLARDQSPGAAGSAKKLNARAEAGMQRLDSVAVVKASYDPYHDFRESMVEMILENDIRTAKDLEDLLQCYLSLNSSDYHKIIVQVFTDIWGDIFEQ